MSASRTPDGQPGRCPLCGANVTIQPAEPLGDAPCPNCGTLLFPLPVGSCTYLFDGDEVTGTQREKLLALLAEYSSDADSLDRVEVVMRIEELLDVRISDEAAAQLNSIDDLVAELRKWLASQSG